MKMGFLTGRGKKLKILLTMLLLLVVIAAPEKNTKTASDVQAQGMIRNGVAKAEDGNWYYYLDNRIIKNFHSLAKCNGYWWYFQNGKLDFSYTGLCKYNGHWWYVSGGKVDFNATGLCKHNGYWFYVKNGKVDFETKTLCKYNGHWWYVSGGKVNFSATGLCKYNSQWFYVKNGKVDFSATTLCKYNGYWFYIQDGKVDFDTSTLCKYNGNWWYVSSGKVNFAATGLCKYNENWFYVRNGKVDFSATTLCKYNENWWYVKNGVVDFSYGGIFEYGGCNWEIRKGRMTQKVTDKIVYLTFDDGPGGYTKQLLEILDKHQVKATFFVTNQSPKYQNLIGEAYRQGHTIALHTYSHNYGIYRSEDAYYADLQKIQQVCVAQTGKEANIVRFPGGTSNLISRNYKKGIMSTLAQSIEQKGYYYCDWNVNSGDAGEAHTRGEVYQNVINGIRGKKNSVVLQHDIKLYSVEAVDDIIRWGKANGYTFLPLSENSQMVHHGTNN